MADTANQIFRDYNTDGDPGSGKHKPIKSEIRLWGTGLETDIADINDEIDDLGLTYLALAGGTMTGPLVATGGLLTVNGQIKFPATQNPSADANTLDDYEEGTFTPAFSATGSTFSYAGGTVGTYTKVGNRVMVDFRLQLNTSGNTLSGNALSMTGLPFAANTSFTLGFPILWTASTSTYVSLVAILVAGTSLTFGGANAAGGVSATTAQNANQVLHATNGSIIRGQFHYRTA